VTAAVRMVGVEETTGTIGFLAGPHLIGSPPSTVPVRLLDRMGIRVGGFRFRAWVQGSGLEWGVQVLGPGFQGLGVGVQCLGLLA